MPMIDDAWQGAVQFWELLFGTWTVYVFLVLLFEKVLREPLEEWRYVLITFLGASFFWINHYFQNMPFVLCGPFGLCARAYLWLLNGYTLVVWIGWYAIAVRGRGSLLWSIAATLCFVVFTIAFIGFEQVARLAEQRGVHEFWIMLASYAGFAFLIDWRRRAGSRRPARAA
jgi:hypothetical protein